MNLITLAELKDAIGVRDQVVDYDARLLTLIDVASTQIEKATRREYGKAARVETFSTTRSYKFQYDFGGNSDDGYYEAISEQTFYLSSIPVDSLETFTVKYDPTRQFADETILGDTTWDIDYVLGRLTLVWSTLSRTNTLQVSYTGGYEVTEAVPDGDPENISASAPADLKHACLLQCLSLWKRTDPNNVGVVDDRAEGSSGLSAFSVSGGITNEAQLLLLPYTRLLVGRR